MIICDEQLDFIVKKLKKLGYRLERNDAVTQRYQRGHGDAVNISPKRTRIAVTKGEKSLKAYSIIHQVVGEPFGKPYKGMENTYHFWVQRRNS